jgi:carbamoyl-phosphate synthase large subunit
MVASGFRFPSKGVLLSLGPIEDKYTLVDEIRVIADELKLPIYATEGTAEALTAVGIACTAASKHQDNGKSAIRLIDGGEIDLIINIPREYDQLGRPDGYLIRRRAVEAGVPLITDLQLARALIEALRQRRMKDLSVLAWQDYMERNETQVP